MKLINKLKLLSSVLLLISLLAYLTYTGITGYLAREIVEIPVVQHIMSNDKLSEKTVKIPEQLDSDTQKAVDKFMQEFNIPLAKKNDFIKKAKDIINKLESPDYEVVPSTKKVPNENLDQCFERVIMECA